MKKRKQEDLTSSYLSDIEDAGHSLIILRFITVCNRLQEHSMREESSVITVKRSTLILTKRVQDLEPPLLRPFELPQNFLQAITIALIE